MLLKLQAALVGFGDGEFGQEACLIIWISEHPLKTNTLVGSALYGQAGF
jgi:hypothetical protein